MTKLQVQALGYENFEQFTEAGGLVAFTSINCPPCRALKPQLKLYAERGHKVGTVDLDESPDIFTALEITALPTVLAIKGNEIKAKHTGTARLNDLLRLGYEADVLAKAA